MPLKGALGEVFRAQLRVGALGFGGPLATMAFMREELVVKRKLVSESRYLEGLAVVKCLPGPVSTLLAVFLGQGIAGWAGGLVSVFAFVFPSFLALLALAVLRDHLPPGALQSGWLGSVMGCLQAAVIVVILATCWKLYSDAAERPYAGAHRPQLVALIALLAGGAAYLGLAEPWILAACAFIGFGVIRASQPRVLPVDLLTLFMVFFTAGCTVFGTGYMILPHLQRILVQEHAWLTAPDFLEAVAWGNLTPGPVVIASTYMGYLMSGWAGACVTTVAIFAGPVLLMLALSPVLKRVLGKPWMEGALLGILPAVAATIAVGSLVLAKSLTWNPVRLTTLALASALTWRKVSVPKIFLAAALLGLAGFWLPL